MMKLKKHKCKNLKTKDERKVNITTCSRKDRSIEIFFYDLIIKIFQACDLTDSTARPAMGLVQI